MIEKWHRTILSILKTVDRNMQEEWDLGVKAACLAKHPFALTCTKRYRVSFLRYAFGVHY